MGTTYPDSIVLRLAGNADTKAVRIRLVDDSGIPVEEIDYYELVRQSKRVAVELRRRYSAGTRIAICLPSGVGFFVAFFGCLFCQLIAVPLPPPYRRQLTRIEAVFADATPRAVIIDRECSQAEREMLRRACEPNGIDILDLVDLGSDSDLSEPFDFGFPESSIAFIQYTSGTTATPKGVCITHDNLIENLKAIVEWRDLGSNCRIFNWLPLFHDFGLVGHALLSVFLGVDCTLMRPYAAIRDPLSWLRGISKFGATYSGGPNFIYDRCVRKLGRLVTSGDMDLSEWCHAISGAERVRAETIEEFARSFAPYGFRKVHFVPSYGLAEATLFVSSKPVALSGICGEESRVIEEFDLEAMERHGIAVRGSGCRLVSCGRSHSSIDIDIVDPAGGKLPDGFLGEIYVKSNSVSPGYWHQLKRHGKFSLTQEGGFSVRTGDVGFIHRKELFIVGRNDDRISLRGRNISPEDIESVVERNCLWLTPSGVAAVSYDGGHGEQLGLVIEIDRAYNTNLKELAISVQGLIFVHHGLALSRMIIARSGFIPKTSSGKSQRSVCRKLISGVDLSKERKAIAVCDFSIGDVKITLLHVVHDS